jgi:hypothetical protein
MAMINATEQVTLASHLFSSLRMLFHRLMILDRKAAPRAAWSKFERDRLPCVRK